MIIIGLTGSIGMGKTTVASLCRRLGLPVDSADEVVHRLLSPQGAAFAPVAELFPDAIVNGAIDRKKLGAAVFGKDEKLAKLEAVLHPLVASERQKFLAHARWQRRRVVVLDIPLLFEKNLEGFADVIVTVSAPAFLQRARVLARPGMTQEKFAQIRVRQMPDAQKRRRSDYVIHTGGTIAATLKQLHRILKEIESAHAPNRSRY